MNLLHRFILTQNTYNAMMSRCYNPNSDSFKYYGECGVSVCSKWKVSIWNFIADMGLRPSEEHTIDRRNNYKGYHKTNCRWATRKQQAKNKKHIADELASASEAYQNGGG
jgi:hypothetical protein